MFKKLAATFVLAIALGGCSSATTGPADGDTSSTCEGGKCDAFAPRALTSIETAFGQCTIVADTQGDQDFARDPVECMFVEFDESARVELHGVFINGKEVPTSQYHSAHIKPEDLGSSQRVANLRPDGYPLELTIQPSIRVQQTSGALSEPRLSNISVLPELTFEVESRPTDQTTLDVELPFELWEVSVWPTKELAAKLAAEEARVVYFSLRSEYEVAGTTYGHSSARILRPTDNLSQLADTVFVVPVNGGVTPTIKTQIDSNEVAGQIGVQGPGYILLEADGTLTPATPQEVEARGYFADDAEPPVVIEDPTDEDPIVTDPVDPNPEVDPCDGACDTTEACVAATCVPLEDQRQFNCSSTPTAACEEDVDCAANNICADGLCRLRECQTQSSSCYDPSRVCEADTDCADGHACAAGLCRRLTCQTQSSSCYDPSRVCEQTSDCAAEHACVEGLCRRLSCQTQSSSCYDPSRVCEADDSCAAGHACVEGLCRRLSCQTQSSSCYDATRPCAADDDCAEGHACLDNLCQRLTCVD